MKDPRLINDRADSTSQIEQQNPGDDDDDLIDVDESLFGADDVLEEVSIPPFPHFLCVQLKSAVGRHIY